jgi:hypothetical protein
VPRQTRGNKLSCYRLRTSWISNVRTGSRKSNEVEPLGANQHHLYERQGHKPAVVGVQASGGVRKLLVEEQGLSRYKGSTYKPSALIRAMEEFICELWAKPPPAVSRSMFYDRRLEVD